MLGLARWTCLGYQNRIYFLEYVARAWMWPVFLGCWIVHAPHLQNPGLKGYLYLPCRWIWFHFPDLSMSQISFLQRWRDQILDQQKALNLALASDLILAWMPFWNLMPQAKTYPFQPWTDQTLV